MESYGTPVEPEKLLKVSQIRNDRTDTIDFIRLAKLHHAECAPHLPFDERRIADNCIKVYQGSEHTLAALLFEGNEAIGYIVAHALQYYFCSAVYTQTEVIFIDPAKRTWKGFKMLMFAFDAWSQSIDAVQQFTGVARVDPAEAEKIQKLFPRLGYKWCGSYFIKEIGR